MLLDLIIYINSTFFNKKVVISNLNLADSFGQSSKRYQPAITFQEFVNVVSSIILNYYYFLRMYCFIILLHKKPKWIRQNKPKAVSYA